MDNITKQDRITLKTLKVADFASEETLCFSATVVFDGTPIAEARNDGHGGSTFLRALSGKAALLAQAETFAQGLPRPEEHTSELPPILRIYYAVFCLKTKTPCRVPRHTAR